MKKINIRSLIREEIKNILTEADLVLYKIRFKSDYSDSKNKEPKTIFSKLSSTERSKIAQYAAVENIGGFGSKEYSTLSTKDKLNTEYVDFKDLLAYVKSLGKTKKTIKESSSYSGITKVNHEPDIEALKQKFPNWTFNYTLNPQKDSSFKYIISYSADAAPSNEIVYVKNALKGRAHTDLTDMVLNYANRRNLALKDISRSFIINALEAMKQSNVDAKAERIWREIRTINSLEEGVSIGAPTQSGVGNIKVGTIVRPVGGPHKNVNHRVMYSNGPRLLIKPMGLKPGENKYKTDSTNTTSNMVRIVKEDIMGAYRRLVITTTQLDTIKKEIENFLKRPNIKTDYPDATVTIKPGVKPDVLVVDIEAVSGTALTAKVSDVVKKFDKAAKIQVRREAKLSKK